MLAYTYIKQGKFELIEKPKPELKDTRDAIVRVTLSSICTPDKINWRKRCTMLFANIRRITIVVKEIFPELSLLP